MQRRIDVVNQKATFEGESLFLFSLHFSKVIYLREILSHLVFNELFCNCSSDRFQLKNICSIFKTFNREFNFFSSSIK